MKKNVKQDIDLILSMSERHLHVATHPHKMIISSLAPSPTAFKVKILYSEQVLIDTTELQVTKSEQQITCYKQ